MADDASSNKAGTTPISRPRASVDAETERDRALMNMNEWLRDPANAGDLVRVPSFDARLTNWTSPYARDTLGDHLVHQAGIRSCWMNLGLRAAEDPSKTGEALFLSMFTGQEGLFSTSPLRVLDTSPGYGDQYLALARIAKDLRYVGINPDNTQVVVAAARTGFAVPFFALSAGNLGLFPANAYDMIVCHENAFHYKSRRQYLKNAYRLLAKGGMLFVHDILRLGRIAVGQGLHSIEEYRSFAASVGFEVVLLEDVSGDILVQSLTDSNRLSGFDQIDSDAGAYFYVRGQFRK
jgi:SAM-dependent methyltransferase